MTQTTDNEMQPVGHFTTFRLVGTPPRNRYDDHPGEWVVWENGQTVAILPTLEAVKEWAAQQLTPIERVALELMRQEASGLKDTTPREFWAGLPDFDQARYIERAEQLIKAFRAGPDNNPGIEGWV